MEFKEYRLFELSKDNKGYYGIGASAVEYDKNLYTYLRITDINDDGSLNYSNLKSVNDENANKFILENGDIVFARTGNSTGKSYYYDGEILNLVYAGFLIKFSLNDKKVNPKFIKYYTMTNEYKNWVKEIQTGSTRGNINEKMYGNMRIKLPPRYYQDEVVSLLDKIDKKIKINNQINDNLYNQAVAIYNESFKGINQREYSIGDYIVPKRGKNLLSRDAILGDVPVVAGGIEPATYHNMSNTKAPVITISASGANAGYINLWNIPVWSSDSSYIDNTITNSIYFWYLTLKNRQKEIFDTQTGSAQPHIYPKHIAELSITKLNESEILKYEKKVTPFFNMIGKNKNENKYLEQLRDKLLPKLMNGEINLDKIEI